MMKFQKTLLSTLTHLECSSKILSTERFAMVFSFLIGSLVFFILNLTSNLLLLAIDAGRGRIPLISIVMVLLSVCLLTWNILALVSY